MYHKYSGTFFKIIFIYEYILKYPSKYNFLREYIDRKCVRYSIEISHPISCWSAFFNILETITSPLKIGWHLYYYVRSRRAYLLLGRNSFVYNKLDWYALKLFLKFIPLVNLFEKHTLIKLGRSHSWQTATQRKTVTFQYR